MQSKFSSYNGIKLEISNRKMIGKISKHLETNNIPPNNSWIKAEVPREMFLHALIWMKIKTEHTKICSTQPKQWHKAHLLHCSYTLEKSESSNQ